MAENKPATYSDLAKIDATTDDEIARQIAEDPDTAPELTDEWFDKADLHFGDRLVRRGRGRPPLEAPKKLVSLRLDQDVIDAFRTSGPGWQSRINAALRERLRANEDPGRAQARARRGSAANAKGKRTDYLRYYDLEKYLFDDVRLKFIRSGVLDPVDFYMILIWKSNRAKNRTKDRLTRATESFEEAVKQISASIHQAGNPKAKLRILMSSPWHLRLPTATAILTVLYPTEFTIYDTRVCEELPAFKGLDDRLFSDRMWELYQRFKSAVEASAPSHLGLRDKDRYLWGKSFYGAAVRAVSGDMPRRAKPKPLKAAVDAGGADKNDFTASTGETRAIVGRTGWYADGKPALEIHVRKSETRSLPIRQNGITEIDLKVGNRTWHAKLHMTQNCRDVWMSPVVIDDRGQRGRLVDALVNFRPNDRVILKTRGREVEVVREGAARR